jgi:hypothetical protein
MKKKPHRPLCRWKALDLLFHFVITLKKKKIKNFVIIFGPGWCKTDNLMLSLVIYLTLSLVHDAPALLKVPMEGTAKRPVDFYGRSLSLRC